MHSLDELDETCLHMAYWIDWNDKNVKITF